ncbi:unnamed protein product, partial [marine sediment metagenome]
VALSQTIVEKTIKVKNQESVTLDFEFADEIKINGWDKNEIYVKVSVNINNNEDNDSFKMDVKENSSSVSFISEIENMDKISKNRVTIRKSDDGERTITYSNGWHIDLDIYFEVFVPKNMEINLETISGDIILTNVEGELDIETISGFIDLAIDKNAKASIKTSTISGSVYTNHDIRINRKNKDKKYNLILGRSPDFDLNGGGRSIKLETISGDIYIRK